MEGYRDGNIKEVRVIYADTDAMGIVYHTNYIKWFEIGRTEMLRSIGIIYAKMESFEFNLPLSKAFCRYLASARFDDVLLVETDIAEIKKASIRFVYCIWNDNMTKKYVEGYTLHACATRDGRLNRFPIEFSSKVEDYLAGRNKDGR
ncbi:MAG: acyl-CoA thioesterase [Deltaproteobacteria bacterium]|nr:acyl-CoA thioesterase [Deltaproteobacteria bacterium]